MNRETITRFDRPQFPLALTDVVVDVANVSNVVDVSYQGRNGTALLNIHTGLFQIMLALGVPVTSSVTLYLDEDGNRMVFGLMVDDRELIDLWHYVPDQVPPAMLP